MKPGEIYYADNPEAGWHRIIVVSREPLNRGRTIVAVPVTSKRFDVRSQLRNCVPFRAGQFGMTEDCVAQCELVSIVPTQSIEIASGPIATISDDVVRSIIHAIGY